MRPPAKPNRYFYHPLDTILGAPAQVRILRMLSLSGDEAWPPRIISWRCQLGRPGTARALARLVAAGIVERHGGRPRFPRYRLDGRTPLARLMRELFEEERRLGLLERRAQKRATRVPRLAG